MVNQGLNGHTNAKLFLNKYFAARFGQLCNLEYATSIMLVAYSPDLVILNGLCASAMGHLSLRRDTAHRPSSILPLDGDKRPWRIITIWPGWPMLNQIRI
jgi:hypothetical protein